MNTIQIMVLLIGQLLLGVPVEETGAIKFQFDNVRSDGGYILLGLYNVEDNFPNKPFINFKVEKQPNEKGQVFFEVKDIKPSQYAVALLDDENNNYEMDFNLIGLPKEGYGFSNNAKPRLFTPPSFDDCRFWVEDQKTTDVQIDLKYWL